MELFSSHLDFGLYGYLVMDNQQDMINLANNKIGYSLYLSEKIHVFKKEIKGKWTGRRTHSLSGTFWKDGGLGYKLSLEHKTRCWDGIQLCKKSL
jgi:hypothetical protein